jgi:XTP/dITP diphosphohydrolase
MQRLVLATNNPGKLRELQALLQPLQFVVLPKSQFTQQEVAETGDSFIANALIKARHASQASGLPAIADDSGIEVAALNGAPGIYSARFAGANASDVDNLHKLLHSLNNTPDARRSARYRCALVYVHGASDAAPLIAEASWEGAIARAPRGNDGFGYDPIFLLPDGRTAAEMSAAEKNRLSHRGQALQQLLLKMQQLRQPC